MANGAFKFKDNSGNVVSFISGSGSNISFSGGTLDLSGMTGLTLGNLTLSGTTQNALSASHASSYLLTSSFNTYSGTTDTVIGTLQTSTSSLNSFSSSATTRLNSIESTTGSLNSYTSSNNTKLGVIESTTGSLNSYTSSNTTNVNAIHTSTSSLNTFTSSATTRLNSIEGVSGSYATTGSNLFKGSQTISGSVIPAVTNTYDLGSPTNNFRHLYLSSASLYIDGTKVLGSTAQELQITTDTGQSFKILEAGSDNITLQSADGNIELKSSGGGDVILDPTTGVIALKGTTTLYAGNKLLSSDGNAIQVGNSLTVTGSMIVTGYIETQELRTTYISSSILYRSGSTKFGDELSDTHSFTGSLSVSGSISVPGSGLISGSSQVLNGSGVFSGSAQLPSGIVSSSAQTIANLPSGTVSGSAQTIANLPSGTVSGSVQVDVMSTTNIARLATTGSNVFTGAITGTSATFSGLVTANSGVLFNTTQTVGSSGTIGFNSTQGLYIYTKTGTSYDFKVYNGIGATFMQVPTGTQNIEFLGTLSGTSATFSSTLTISGDIYASNGTSTAASIRFNNANTGFYHPTGTDNLGIITSGTQKAIILANGNVGINVVAPTEKLQVNGSFRFGDSTNYLTSSRDGTGVYMELAGTSTATRQLRIQGINDAGTSYSSIRLEAGASQILFVTADVTRLTIASTGAATFSSNLSARQLLGDGGSTGGIKILNDNGELKGSLFAGGSAPRPYGHLLLKDASNNDAVMLRTTGGDNFILHGNFGIGTVTPVAALNVSNIPTSYYGIIETTGTSAGTIKHFRVHKPGYVEYGIGILADNSFHISTASTFPTTNGFTLTSGGNVTIGGKLTVTSGYYLYGGGYNTSYTSDGLWGGSATPNKVQGVSGGNFILGYNDNGSGLYAPAYGFEVRQTDGLGNNITMDAIIMRNTETGARPFIVTNKGSLTLAGSLSKGSGSFKINHPLQSKKNKNYLVHSFLEGPKADLLYRGKINLVNGLAIINIDTTAGMTEGTFEVLCRDIQCFTTNESGWDLVKGTIIGNILTITSQNSDSNDLISWLVIGERQDEHMYETEWTDENGHVILEPEIPEGVIL